MNKKIKVRRSCLLCLSFVRNYAFYRAAWNDDGAPFIGGTPGHDGITFLLNQYWNTTIGNYIDIATLEWCKLFGNSNQEKFHWKKVVRDKPAYKVQLLTVFGQDDASWQTYHEKIMKYRDQFIAHLDENNTYYVPYLEVALKLVFNHYDYLVQNESEEHFFPEAIPDIRAYYGQHLQMARNVYEIQNAAR